MCGRPWVQIQHLDFRTHPCAYRLSKLPDFMGVFLISLPIPSLFMEDLTSLESFPRLGWVWCNLWPDFLTRVCVGWAWRVPNQPVRLGWTRCRVSGLGLSPHDCP